MLIMKTNKRSIIRVAIILLLAWAIVTPVFCQTPSEMFAHGLNMADQAIKDDNMHSYAEGLKIMKKALKKDKKRADWCYEIGSRYYYHVTFGGHFFAWDKEKGIKWFKEGAKLGDLKSSLVLFKHYKPESQPYGILAPKSEWKQYFKERDISWKYAGIALNAEIPSNFSDYLTLSDAASFTKNADLANRYAAIAADNNEPYALNYIIADERALDYLTSPEVMYEAASAMWKRDKNEYGHNDRDNGFIWFEKSAKAGYPLAQYQMGCIYLNGLTVKPDTLKAVSWYKLSAKNNFPSSISALGRLYINGKGIEKDVDRGFKLLNESADSGHVNSKLYLGYCYLYGLGTPQDTQRARDLFQNYFDSFNHKADQRLIIVDNRVIDLDYLIGLTYYYENSPECIPLFEASLKSNTFVRLQRSDLLRKLALCYKNDKWLEYYNLRKSEELLNEARKFGNAEISESNFML